MHTCRLYQFISDQQAEPRFIYPEFWLDADGQRVPVPCVDHLVSDLDYVRTRWSAHASAYVSRGRGLGELRPIFDQRAGSPPFRFGSSRTMGLELRAAWQPEWAAGSSAAITYVWSRSERLWSEEDWRPWILDRRHTVRLQVDAALDRRWRVSAVGEYQSGQPLTPVAEVVSIEPPAVDGVGSPVPGRIAYRYGTEGSARSAGTFRCDLAARLALRGPRKSRIEVAFSLLNAGFGPVSPEVPVPPQDLLRTEGAHSDAGVRYQRQFALPAIPSISVRVEF
jgi:hypothetical protein